MGISNHKAPPHRPGLDRQGSMPTIPNIRNILNIPNIGLPNIPNISNILNIPTIPNIPNWWRNSSSEKKEEQNAHYYYNVLLEYLSNLFLEHISIPPCYKPLSAFSRNIDCFSSFISYNVCKIATKFQRHTDVSGIRHQQWANPHTLPIKVCGRFAAYIRLQATIFDIPLTLS